MANDLNKFMCIGRLGKDPEVRYMPNGNAVVGFSIALGESWKDKNTGEKQERTEWVNCSAFGKLAEIIGEYVKKGSKIYIDGKMRTEKYTGNDGVEKYATKIIVDNMQMLDSKSDNAGQPNPQQSASNGQNNAQQSARPQQRPQAQPSNSGYQQQGQQNAQTGLPAGDDWDDSDIPF